MALCRCLRKIRKLYFFVKDLPKAIFVASLIIMFSFYQLSIQFKIILGVSLKVEQVLGENFVIMLGFS